MSSQIETPRRRPRNGDRRDLGGRLEVAPLVEHVVGGQQRLAHHVTTRPSSISAARWRRRARRRPRQALREADEHAGAARPLAPARARSRGPGLERSRARPPGTPAAPADPWADSRTAPARERPPGRRRGAPPPARGRSIRRRLPSKSPMVGLIWPSATRTLRDFTLGDRRHERCGSRRDKMRRA